MRKEFHYLIAISMFFVLAVIVVGGLRMPWSEEGALYAIYGSAVGFYAAIAMSMFVVWKMQRRK
ncbi:MAG: hypothetical protein LBQ42_02480 [Synergistaceae bacterium]|jgi:hypothetical protein|nr:hypothetical protein [Synergistaceae bacterium]